MEHISILNVIIAAITLIVVCYFPIINYRRRPKLILQPEIKEQSNRANESYFGVSVENKGKNIAKDVYGEIVVNNTSMQINWNNWWFRKTCGHSERIFQLDINPGSTCKRWFIANRLAGENRRTLEGSEILVTLNWEYHGQNTLTKKLVYPLQIKG